ncbi:hypothetical protein [Silvanigrella aquatica]|uniref:Ketopantoate reductase N-terminal domain-containing protein n=1 Tax=Silvanigrella aquatica TaxID=1915309 RepID=A0A1L4D343_9BACT|nr:hypothetical protein [Silvanigrella aquatica]APJ04623.1 hypothetical protein AXG55_12205 [Silvanigrella aquatica]
MFLRRQHLQSRNMQRVVIGAGALGLFLYHCLEQEYSQKTLKIISNSWFQKPIMIESLDKHVDQLNPSSYFLAENLEKTFPLLSEKTIIFYICLPPEASLTALNYIEIILNKNPQIKTNVILFMNNGILDYQYLTQFIKKDSLHRCRETYCMRALVVSGFMRTFLDNKILIQNTSGKEIYYGFFKNKPPFSINFILPKNYLTWHYSKKYLCYGNREVFC